MLISAAATVIFALMLAGWYAAVVAQPGPGLLLAMVCLLGVTALGMLVGAWLAAHLGRQFTQRQTEVEQRTEALMDTQTAMLRNQISGLWRDLDRRLGDAHDRLDYVEATVEGINTAAAVVARATAGRTLLPVPDARDVR